MGDEIPDGDNDGARGNRKGMAVQRDETGDTMEFPLLTYEGWEIASRMFDLNWRNWDGLVTAGKWNHVEEMLEGRGEIAGALEGAAPNTAVEIPIVEEIVIDEREREREQNPSTETRSSSESRSPGSGSARSSFGGENRNTATSSPSTTCNGRNGRSTGG